MDSLAIHSVSETFHWATMVVESGRLAIVKINLLPDKAIVHISPVNGLDDRYWLDREDPQVPRWWPFEPEIPTNH